MARIVNLRTARKQRTRAGDRQRVERETARAAADPVEAERLRAEAELERRRLDGHRRDDPER
jgi:hypothetical protein